MLQQPLEDLLEHNRTSILSMAIDVALGKDTSGKVNVSVLNKLLDKLLPNKKESKVDANHKFNVSIESLIADL